MTPHSPARSEATLVPHKPRIRTALGRGIRGRCPRCGEGRLFQRWIVTFERCSSCHFLFQRNYGDIWMFTNIMDRFPILFGIGALFFGYRSNGLGTGLMFLAAMAVPAIATLRHRQGLALALDYLMRIYMPDPSDELHGGDELTPSEARQLAASSPLPTANPSAPLRAGRQPPTDPYLSRPSRARGSRANDGSIERATA